MCLIVAKDSGSKLDIQAIRNGWEFNNDGWGLARWNDGLEIVKGLGFGGLKEVLDKVKDEDKIVLHLRKASIGKVSLDNCHPFKVVDGVYLFHNGTVSWLGDKDKTDSQDAAEKVFRPLIERYGLEILDDELIETLVLGYLGTRNRFCLVHENGFKVLNRQSWVEDNEILYSNAMYRMVKAFERPSPKFLSFFQKARAFCPFDHGDGVVLKWKNQ